MAAFFRAFLLTQFVECVTVLLVARYLFGFPASRFSTVKLLVTCFLASTITLPILWFVLPDLLQGQVMVNLLGNKAAYPVYVVLGETFVWLVEACVYQVGLKVRWGEALLISLICNLASFSAGMAMS